MIVKKARLTDKAQTGREMYRLTHQFHTDLPAELKKKSFNDFFNLVKNMRYHRDLKPIEVVARPKYLLSGFDKGLDCKKKAILIGAYLKAKKIPFRFVAVSQVPSGRIHHVFPQAKIGGNWINTDATYPEYYPGQPKKVTAFEVLKK